MLLLELTWVVQVVYSRCDEHRYCMDVLDVLSHRVRVEEEGSGLQDVSRMRRVMVGIAALVVALDEREPPSYGVRGAAQCVAHIPSLEYLYAEMTQRMVVGNALQMDHVEVPRVFGFQRVCDVR